MIVLALKLVVTPLLIGGASLASRRWGPVVAGWLVALPLTSGPVAFFLALDHGVDFAAGAVVGSLGGLAAIVAYSLAYASVATRAGVAASLAAASVAYILSAVVLESVLASAVPMWVLLAGVVAVIAVGVRLLPEGSNSTGRSGHPPWDLPARMIVGTALVVGLTTVAPALGPQASGLVATFPVYVSVMATFGQRHGGAPAAIGLLRGLLLGLFATAGFYAIVNLALRPLGVGPAFGLAIGAALAVQAVALRAIQSAAASAPDASA